MKNRSFAECSVVALIGAVLYGILEILWRGYTHWSMLICGGVCLGRIYAWAVKEKKPRLWVRCVHGGLFITAVEFSAGCIFNLALGMRVWDYSSQPLNIMGQVCGLYTLLWGLLCLPADCLCRLLRRFLHCRKGSEKLSDEQEKGSRVFLQ